MKFNIELEKFLEEKSDDLTLRKLDYFNLGEKVIVLSDDFQKIYAIGKIVRFQNCDNKEKGLIIKNTFAPEQHVWCNLKMFAVIRNL